jgi:Na+/melibiose symporter-like transporter
MRNGSLPLWQLAVYGGPAVPLAVLLLPLYVTLPTYYAKDLGVGFAAVGTVLTLTRLWDVVTDPIIGLLSDRTRSRFGRRRPWLLGGMPLVILAVWLLFAPPLGVSALHLLIWTVVLYLGGTMMLLPYSAWGAELSPDYHERSRITAVRESAVIAGTVLALAVPALLGMPRVEVMENTAWALTVLLPVTVLLAVALLPDDARLARQPASPAESGLSRRQKISLLWRNKPFRLLIGAHFINGIAYGLPATLFLLFVEEVLRRPDWAWPLLGVYFASAVAGVPFWLWLSRRIGKHQAWRLAMAIAAGTFWTAMLLGEGDVYAFLVLCIVTGVPLGAELALPPSMQADVVDLDTLRSGRRRAGVFFAAWGVATKVPLALAVGIAFPILGLVGFEQAGGEQTPAALLTLASLYSLGPVIIKLTAIWILRDYPIDAAEQRRIREEIATRDAAAPAAGQPA